MRSSVGLGKKRTKGQSPASTGRLTVHQTRGEALVSQKKTEPSVKTVERVSDMIDQSLIVPSSNITGWGQQRAFFRATAMLVALRNRGQEFREGSSQFPRKRHVQTSIQVIVLLFEFEQYPSWYKCLKWQSYNIILAFTFDVHWQRRGCWNSNLICLYKKVPFLFSESKLLLHFHECHYIVALLHITLIQDTDKWLEFYKSGLSLSPQWRHHCGVDCGGSMPLWCGGSMPAASCMFDRSQVTVTKLRSALFCPMFLFEWSSISMSYSIFIFTPL